MLWGLFLFLADLSRLGAFKLAIFRTVAFPLVHLYLLSMDYLLDKVQYKYQKDKSR